MKTLYCFVLTLLLFGTTFVIAQNDEPPTPKEDVPTEEIETESQI